MNDCVYNIWRPTGQGDVSDELGNGISSRVPDFFIDSLSKWNRDQLQEFSQESRNNLFILNQPHGKYESCDIPNCKYVFGCEHALEYSVHNIK